MGHEAISCYYVKMKAEATIAVDVTKNKKVYTGVALRAMKLQAGGATQRETALALGVDESLISQYNAEQDYKEQLHDMVSKAFKDAQEIDQHYQSIEHKLSKKLLDLTEFMMNPDQVLRTLKFANEAKRKLGPSPVNGTGHNGDGPTKLTPVVLVLPMVVKREFVLNPQNEIVGVDGNELVTLNSTTLNSMVAKRTKEKEVQKLPNGTKRESTDPYSDL